MLTPTASDARRRMRFHRRAGLVARFVGFLALQHPNNNVHNLRVARLLVGPGGALPPPQLIALGTINKVTLDASIVHLPNSQ